MSRARIAPTLQDCALSWNSSVATQARAELRALLAVARAAEKYRVYHACDELGCPVARDMDRALTRLRRASERGGGR